MARPAKKVKLSAPALEPAFSESEDEWEAERVKRAGGEADQQEGSDSEDGEGEGEDAEEDGVAQFEDDDDEDYLNAQYDDEGDEQAALSRDCPEISTIPFTSLLKAQKKLSSKKRSTTAQSSDDESSDGGEDQERPADSRKRNDVLGVGATRPLKQERRKNGSLKKADRASKHAPMEMSSKRAVGRKREVVENMSKPVRVSHIISPTGAVFIVLKRFERPPTQQARDPRFDSLSGAFKPELFSKSYSFLADAQSQELEALRKTAKAARKSVAVDPDERARIEAALVRMESRETERKRREREREALREWKRDEEKKREQGKGEFYLKKAEKKKVLLKAKYEALAGDKKQLRKSIEKKRKKTAQKDKKLIPRERVS